MKTVENNKKDMLYMKQDFKRDINVLNRIKLRACKHK
jgi:hypothetical protein